MSTTMAICPEPQANHRLDHPAEASRGAKPSADAGAIRDFADLNEWQIQEIRTAIAEAERGDFASDGPVRDVLDKWGVDVGQVARDGAGGT